ncbi:hypothetical protein AB0F68_00075 [Micromonospora sp. NPDC023966]|uniref:hypothetical protein n=1 Tax=Micromonospora sp. NPDC023966 TaxID=3154699 RepID=UPI0033CC6CA3
MFSFLFAGFDSDLGVAIECGWDRMELLSYSPNDNKFEPLALTRFLGDAVLVDGDGRGNVQAPRECGIAIGALADGKASAFPSPVTVDGTTFNVSGGDSGCESVVLVRSPAPVGDRLFFMTAPDSLGRLPLPPEVDPEDFTWYLTEWDGKSARGRFLTKLPGMADLALSPNGRSMIAAVVADVGDDATDSDMVTSYQFEPTLLVTSAEFEAVHGGEYVVDAGLVTRS